MKNKRLAVIAVRWTIGILSLNLLPRIGWAQESPRSEAKPAVEKWTLQEWIEQKNRNTLMDMWLVMHTPSPYEFFLSGTFESYSRSTTSAGANSNAKLTTSEQGAVGAFATITGLVGEFENNTSEGFTDLNGSFQLRLLGPSIQGSHLILMYGLRDRQYNSANANAKLANTFGGANLELDLTKFFGIQGDYRYYFPVTENVFGSTQGRRLEVGAFLDFKKVRVFGNIYHETQDSVLNQVDTRTNRDGIFSGIAIFY